MTDSLTKPVPVEQEPQHSEPELRGGRLAFTGFLGAALVALAVVLNMRAGREDVWATLASDVGTGILLFAALLYVERKVVTKELRSQTQRIVEALNWSEDQVRELMSSPDAKDLLDRFDDDGSVRTAFRWMKAMATGGYEMGWQVSDYDWRLSRVQAFRWNNRDHFEHDTSILDELAEAIAKDITADIAQPFLEAERRQFLETWGYFDPDDLGAASKRRPVAPDYEIAILTPAAASAPSPTHPSCRPTPFSEVNIRRDSMFEVQHCCPKILRSSCTRRQKAGE